MGVSDEVDLMEKAEDIHNTKAVHEASPPSRTSMAETLCENRAYSDMEDVARHSQDSSRLQWPLPQLPIQRP